MKTESTWPFWLIALGIAAGGWWVWYCTDLVPERTPCDVDTPEQRAYCQHVTGHPARARRMWR